MQLRKTLGFAGFGAVSRFTDNYTGIKSSNPTYASAVNGNKLKTGSGKYSLWNGKLDDHRWHKHGYTGKREADAKTRGGKKVTTNEGPLYVCDETGYYAHRASTYLMRYDKIGNQLGYDAMENRYDANGNMRKPITALPAGVPIAMVGQFFVHDPPGTAWDFLQVALNIATWVTRSITHTLTTLLRRLRVLTRQLRKPP